MVARVHEERLERLPHEAWLGVQSLAHELARALDGALAPRRMFVCALGSAAPRATSFPHVHVHVIPIFDGDERDRPAEVLTWNGGVFAYEGDEAAELSAAIRTALQRTR